MERINCPVCGYRTLIAYGTDVWGDYGPVVLQHSVPGTNWTPCSANWMHPDDARGVGRILEQGGERLRLAAHP